VKRFILALILAGMSLRPDLAAISAEKAKDPPAPAPLKDSPAMARPEPVRPAGQGVPRRPKTWRALIEEAVLLTASTIDYWGAYSKFTADWQFTWATFGQKFFTAQSPKMDSNAFWYNWSHAGAGAGYYTMARTNGLDNRVSTLFSFVTSAVWESMTEWRELIATNDMVFTTFGGPAIGEPLYQISSYFSHRRGIVNGVAGFVFNPFLTVNNWFDRRSGAAANSATDSGWHRFNLYAGLKEDKISPSGTTAADQSGPVYRQFNLGFDMETDASPGAGRESRDRRFLWDTLSSRAAIDVSFSSAGLEEFRIRTSAVLFGGSSSSVALDTDGSLHGGSVSLGYGTAFEVLKKRSVAWYDSNNEVPTGGQATAGDSRFFRPTPTAFTDKLSVISPLGAVLVLSRFGARCHLRWTSAAYGDFALVNALAYNRFTESHETGGVKTTLLNWGYYYALGMTLTSDAAVDWRQWRFRGEATWQFYDSIQGQDRYQYTGVVTEDFKLRDTRLVWRLTFGYRLTGTPLELGLAAEGISRTGRLPGLSDHCRELSFFYQARLVF
jgi:hypothetical protein